MSNIHRVCPECSARVAMEARYCAQCGYDAEMGVPATERQLPATLGKAALPILAGAAGLAVRAAWRLLQNRAVQEAAQNVAQNALQKMAQPQPPATPESRPQPRPWAESARTPRRTIRIRSSWAVGDANGIWRHGTSEHTIELDD